MKIHRIILLAVLAISIFLASKSLWTRKLLAQSQPTPYTLSAVTLEWTPILRQPVNL